MYSRNRYNREDNKNYYQYNLPPRYDGNAFPLSRPDIVSDASEVIGAGTPSGMTLKERNDTFVKMRARPPIEYRNTPDRRDAVVDDGGVGELLNDDDDFAEIGTVAFENSEEDARECSRDDSSDSTLNEQKRGFGDLLGKLFDKFSREDLLLLGLILIIAGDGGECSDKGLVILALVLLFGIRD